MTDWGVHWLDIVQLAFQEEIPTEITALGGRFWSKDNGETPDTLQVTYNYPSGFIATYERRSGNSQSMFGKGGGILFCGSKGTMFLDRGGYKIVSERVPMPPQPPGEPRREPVLAMAESEEKSTDSGNANHWTNFLDCVRSRQKPASDIETCQRSTTTCLLGNVALRSHLRLDWDAHKWTTTQGEARKFLTREYRKPWKLVV